MPLSCKYWIIAIGIAVLGSCTKRTNNTPIVADVIQIPDIAATSVEPDCERIAREYIPCLPFPDTPVLQPLQPPEPFVRLPCNDHAKRLDVFTDLQSPEDIQLLQKIVQEQNTSSNICLFLHPFGDAVTLGTRLFTLLATQPHNGWQILREYVQEKLYLTWMAEYGPSRPLPVELQKQIDVAKQRAQDFGVRKNPLLLINGYVRMANLSGQFDFNTTETEVKNPAKTALPRITWMKTNPRQEELTREFTLLCKTRQNWRSRMTTIQECLSTPTCDALKTCVSDRLYEQEWAEMEIAEPTHEWKTMAVMGEGPVVLHVWLDPDCPHSRELFFHLRTLIQNTPIRVEIEFIATQEKGNWVREALFQTNNITSLCFLNLVFSYYNLLDIEDFEKIPKICGMREFTLQNKEKNDTLPAGLLPPFCGSRITPCMYVAGHVLEGSLSINFLHFVISRAAKKLSVER